MNDCNILLRRRRLKVCKAFNRNNTIHVYSCFIAFLPIISIYASGIPGLTLGDVCLILLFFFSVISSKKSNTIGGTDKSRVIRTFLILAFYYLVSFCCSTILQPNPPIVEMSIRIIRFLFYIIVLLELSKKYFDYEIASKWVRRISVAATFYVVLQYILYFKYSYILKGYLQSIPIYLKEYSVIDYAERYQWHFFRASSFFLEPAHYAQFAVLGLCFALTGYTQKNQYSLINAILISIGIILSTSIQGIIITAILWLIWIPVIYSRNRNKKGIMTVYILLVCLPVLMYYMLGTDVVQNTLSRITEGKSQDMSAYNARFGGVTAINSLKGIFFLIGKGFGQVPEELWMNSAAYVWYGTGIIGIALTFYLLIKCFIVSKTYAAKLVCFIYLILFFSSDIFNSYMCIFYFSFMCFGTKITQQIHLQTYTEKWRKLHGNIFRYR